MRRVLDVAALVPHGAVRAYVMGDRGGANAEATPEEIEPDGRGGPGGDRGRGRRVLDHPHDPAPGQGRRARRGHHGQRRRADRHRPGAGRRRCGRVRAGQRHVRPRGRVRLDGDRRPGVRPARSRSTASRTTSGPSTGAGSSSWPTMRPPRAPASSPRSPGRPACVLLGWDSTAHPFTVPPHLAGDRRPAPRGAAGPAAHRRGPRRHAGRGPRAGGHRRLPHVVVPQAVPARGPARVRAARPTRASRPVAARQGTTPEAVAYDHMLRRATAGACCTCRCSATPTATSAPSTRCSSTPAPCSAWATAAPTAACCATPRCRRTCSATGSGTGPAATAWGLEQAVHLQTRRTAALYGFDDRGLLAPGYLADVNVIDFDALAIEAPEIGLRPARRRPPA